MPPRHRYAATDVAAAAHRPGSRPRPGARGHRAARAPSLHRERDGAQHPRPRAAGRGRRGRRRPHRRHRRHRGECLDRWSASVLLLDAAAAPVLAPVIDRGPASELIGLVGDVEPIVGHLTRARHTIRMPWYVAAPPLPESPEWVDPPAGVTARPANPTRRVGRGPGLRRVRVPGPADQTAAPPPDQASTAPRPARARRRRRRRRDRRRDACGPPHPALRPLDRRDGSSRASPPATDVGPFGGEPLADEVTGARVRLRHGPLEPGARGADRTCHRGSPGGAPTPG